MPVSMYEVSVPVFISMLSAMSHVLKKAEASAKERGLEESVLVEARHAPDMLPLKNQVYIATDMAKGCASRLAGRDVPSYQDVEATFPDLLARIQKTLDYLATFEPDDMKGSEDRDITLKIAGNDMTFPGRAYVLGFVHPNFYFHVTTCYSILRANGVKLGKADYFGQG